MFWSCVLLASEIEDQVLALASSAVITEFSSNTILTFLASMSLTNHLLESLQAERHQQGLA